MLLVLYILLKLFLGRLLRMIPTMSSSMTQLLSQISTTATFKPFFGEVYVFTEKLALEHLSIDYAMCSLSYHQHFRLELSLS